MLARLRSPVFRAGEVVFHDGLNVVLGDPVGANSIGKSTLLLLVDFAFGGSDLGKVLPDLTSAQALGHHYYDITFLFAGHEHSFRRKTDDPDLVLRLDADGTPGDVWKLAEYTAWLKDSYSLAGEGTTFRAAVAPFSRVWQRDTLDPQRPLHSVSRQRDADAVANLLKLFQRYDEIRAIEQVLRVSEEKSTAATDAEKVGLLPRVTSRARERNVDEIRKAEAELESIRSDLALYAANISQVLNREVLELKEKKDSLLRQQLQMQSRLRRIEQNLSGVRAARQRDFLALRDFFPSIDADRLSTVEAFHSGISGVLRAELRSARTHLEASLKAIDLELAEIDSALRSFLRNVAQPTRVVDRVVAVATQLREREEENAVYDEHERLTSELTTQRASLRKAREKQTGDVAARINEELVSLTTQIFAEGRRAPELLLRPTKYSYEVERDTGTGTAFASVVLLDMAVLELSQLPYLIHDSVVFKNIEAEVVSRMIQRYVRFQKQVFIAIDEAPKYGALTVKRLEKHAVCRLTNKNLLFKVDWRL